jgi:hypothetical protein
MSAPDVDCSDERVAAEGLDLEPHAETMRRFAATGQWTTGG